MDKRSVWKRRPQFGLTESEDARFTWAGPISPKLYGDQLQMLCASTEANLERLRASSQQVSPSPQSSKKRPQTAPVQRPRPPHMGWENTAVMFTSKENIMELGKRRQSDDTASLSSTASNAPCTFCYLCSTMAEHRRHHMNKTFHRQNLHTARPRVDYIAPKPRVRQQDEEEVVQPAEALYKLEVFTGDISGASANIQVKVSIKGSQDVLLPTPLRQGRRPTVTFVRGQRQTFFVKGPHLGELEMMHVEHEGKERQHAWYLEKIIVTDMQTMDSWLFLCKNWLSRFHGDHLTYRDLRAARTEKLHREYNLIVETGNKMLAGTDAKVFVTFFGTLGCSPKFHLNSHRKGCFQKGQRDEFTLSFPDIGEIRKMRIEHDGTGVASGWFLSMVTLRERVLDGQKTASTLFFPYRGWIARDVGSGVLHREIKAKKKLEKEVVEGEKIRYEVEVKTGDVRYAGTDANVFIHMVGPSGKTRAITLDDARDNFERGMTEIFDVTGVDVGPLTAVVVGHDNTMPGAGWFLEELKVKRYLSRFEQEDRLKKMKKAFRMKMEKKKKKKRGSLRDGARDDDLEDEDEDDDDDDESDEEVDENVKGSKASRRKGSLKRSKSQEKMFAEALDREGRIVKRPEYEEYTFPCHQWIAKDEGEGKVEVELTPKRSETFYTEVVHRAGPR